MESERNRFRTFLRAGAISVLTLGAIGTIGAVQAHGTFSGAREMGPGFGGPMGERMFERALGSVEATDEQREEIRVIVDEAREEIRTMTADLEDHREQFKALLFAEEIDRNAIELLRQTMLETGDAVSARALEALLDAAEILSPEQRAELLEQSQRSGPRFGHRFGHGFGPHRN